MSGSLRFEVPSALDYFAMLVADDASLSLVEAAASIGQDIDPQLDVQAVLAEIDTLASRLRRRIPADAVPLHRLRWLNRFFFQDLGFAGNVNHYDDPRNSYLHEVLRSRRGIPITLAVLYIELAQEVGLVAGGVSFPGHFLVKLRLSQGQRQGEVLIDPFSGRSLSRDELSDMLLPLRRSHGLVGEEEAPLGMFLHSATHREVLARMLRNLKNIYRDDADWTRLLAVQRRLVVLLPRDWEERRDRGLAYAELARLREAADDLAAYVEHCPQADDANALADRLAELRRAAPPRGR
jgi:regulator of sirC expression with transglutaminase-like and TPR domain